MTKRETKALRQAQTKFLVNLMAREEAKAKAHRESQQAQPKPEQTKAA